MLDLLSWTEDAMTVSVLFEHWRAVTKAQNNWGLAWFLANEFCRRFYSSHGIAPHLIEHDGLGYYGIQLVPIPCKVNGQEAEPLGRMSMMGDVENWAGTRPDEPHESLIRLCDSGAPTAELIRVATLMMAIPPLPSKPHVNCHHKRRGASYELLFEIATCIALRNPMHIINDPALAAGYVSPKVLPARASETGVFAFGHSQRVVVLGDGEVLGEKNENLWIRYMRGESVEILAKWIEEKVEG
jgi:hypothetical protein